MKQIIFSLFFLVFLTAYAEGPIFQHTETEKQQEFENVYQDIRHILSSDTFIKDQSTLQSGATFYVSSGTALSFYASTITAANRIVIGTADTRRGKIIIGSTDISLERSVDSTFLNTRNVSNATYDSAYGSEHNAHAFSDSAILNRSVGGPGASVGYNSFDHRILVNGGFDYDHIAGFQALPVFSSTGTISNVYSLFGGLTMTTGTVTNFYVVYGTSVGISGSGNVQHQYGIWMNSALSNYVGGGFLGVTDASITNNGNWGEQQEGTVSSVSSVGTSGQWWDAQSITLSAGDWDISALIAYRRNSAPMSDVLVGCGISTTSGNSAAGLTQGVNYFEDSYGVALTSFTSLGLTVPSYRVNFSGADRLYYLKGIIQTYTSGTPQYRCRISARRASH